MSDFNPKSTGPEPPSDAELQRALAPWRADPAEFAAGLERKLEAQPEEGARPEDWPIWLRSAASIVPGGLLKSVGALKAGKSAGAASLASSSLLLPLAILALAVAGVLSTLGLRADRKLSGAEALAETRAKLRGAVPTKARFLVPWLALLYFVLVFAINWTWPPLWIFGPFVLVVMFVRVLSALGAASKGQLAWALACLFQQLVLVGILAQRLGLSAFLAALVYGALALAHDTVARRRHAAGEIPEMRYVMVVLGVGCAGLMCLLLGGGVRGNDPAELTHWMAEASQENNALDWHTIGWAADLLEDELSAEADLDSFMPAGWRERAAKAAAPRAMHDLQAAFDGALPAHTAGELAGLFRVAKRAGLDGYNRRHLERAVDALGKALAKDTSSISYRLTGPETWLLAEVKRLDPVAFESLDVELMTLGEHIDDLRGAHGLLDRNGDFPARWVIAAHVFRKEFPEAAPASGVLSRWSVLLGALACAVLSLLAVWRAPEGRAVEVSGAGVPRAVNVV